MKQNLYRFYDNEGRLLYVGITNEWFRRFHNHERKATWFSEVASATFEFFETREEVELAEKIAIQNENPIWNKVHNVRYESPMDHFQKLKFWTFTSAEPDDLHYRFIEQTKDSFLALYGDKERKSSMRLASTLLPDLHWAVSSGFSCRNCAALLDSSQLKTWAEYADENYFGDE